MIKMIEQATIEAIIAGKNDFFRGIPPAIQ
jgi:hypothetical protein